MDINKLAVGVIVVVQCLNLGCQKKESNVFLPAKVNEAPDEILKTKPALETSTEKKIEDKGKILAKVNGAPIYEKDVNMPVPRTLPPGIEVSNYMGSALQEAIEMELLYQEAKKSEFDKKPEYQQALNEYEKQMVQIELSSLARYYESKSKELAQANVLENISEGEVLSYYDKHKDRYDRFGQEKAMKRIRAVLANNKREQVYKGFITALIEKTTITINGQILDKGVIITTLEGKAYVYSTQPMMQDALLYAVRNIVIAQEAKGSGFSEEEILKDTNRINELLLKAVVDVGELSFVIGDCSQVSEMLKRAETMPAGPVLSAVLKNYIVANAAQKEGLDKSAEWLAQKKSRHFGLAGPMVIPPLNRNKSMKFPSFWGVDAKKAVLVSLLLEERGFFDYENISISPQEIENYYQKYKNRYDVYKKRLNQDKINELIIRTLRYEKANQMKESYLRQLRQSAQIELIKQPEIGTEAQKTP